MCPASLLSGRGCVRILKDREKRSGWVREGASGRDGYMCRAGGNRRLGSVVRLGKEGVTTESTRPEQARHMARSEECGVKRLQWWSGGRGSQVCSCRRRGKGHEPVRWERGNEHAGGERGGGVSKSGWAAISTKNKKVSGERERWRRVRKRRKRPMRKRGSQGRVGDVG
ncbi:uncharacterized protein A4U43_C02F18030 [Asparagus officinalis]|uniref:Uncharacterized protein n=1 Tax=Asparagus officinalis TaxID=4686 RepID=A0A5P1FNV1_ASPOF|nr:uncharacterized protein A4U43_C02F18030 [Asparagus officinalis]